MYCATDNNSCFCYLETCKASPNRLSNLICSSYSLLPKEVTVTLDKNGFRPATVTINVSSAVRWKNESGAQQTVNSDNYPTNQLHRDLNFGVFTSGSSVTHTFTTPGTYEYHNQFHHEQTGKIIVIK